MTGRRIEQVFSSAIDGHNLPGRSRPGDSRGGSFEKLELLPLFLSSYLSVRWRNNILLSNNLIIRAHISPTLGEHRGQLVASELRPVSSILQEF
jgi:hypothetical protein